MKRIVTTLAIALMLPACGKQDEGKQPAKEPPPPETPELAEPEAEEAPELDLEKALTAAELANAIEREPERAEEILADADLTREDFEAMLFEVAEDPLLAEAYAKSREPVPGAEEGVAQADDIGDPEG